MKGVVVPKCIPEAHRATQASAGGALIPKFKSTLVALATVAAGAVLAASPASATGSSWTKTVNTSSPSVVYKYMLYYNGLRQPISPQFYSSMYSVTVNYDY